MIKILICNIFVFQIHTIITCSMEKNQHVARRGTFLITTDLRVSFSIVIFKMLVYMCD